MLERRRLRDSESPSITDDEEEPRLLSRLTLRGSRATEPGESAGYLGSGRNGVGGRGDPVEREERVC